jgi:hypothetical protein
MRGHAFVLRKIEVRQGFCSHPGDSKGWHPGPSKGKVLFIEVLVHVFPLWKTALNVYISGTVLLWSDHYCFVYNLLSILFNTEKFDSFFTSQNHSTIYPGNRPVFITI